MFWALKGATRRPSCLNMRHSAVTRTLFPTDDDVPFSKHLRDVYSFLHGFATTEMAWLNAAPVD